MQIISKNITDIHPYANNPRKNDQAVDAVASSIREFGFKVPVVIDKNGEIIAGHTRYKAAKKLKLKEIPCIIADDLTEEQIKAFRLADNKVGELAEWDLDMLDIELDEITEIDMEEFGFYMPDMESEAEAIEDDFDATPPEEPVARFGQIYKLGRHRLMCGDSTDPECVKKLMDGEKADMVFTDPPYNVNYSSKNKFLNEIDKGNRIQDDIENDNYDSDEEVGKKLWKPAFQNMRDNAKDYCSIYVTMPQGGAHMMMMMMASASWKIKHELIWVKNNHVLGRTDYFYKHEPIMFGWAETHKFYGKGEFNKSVWEIDKPAKSDLHPTMKPIRLIENAILNSSAENDCIMDLFGGSGSTLIACEQLDRTCYMMEYEPHYIDVIIKRWEEFTGRKAELINDNRRSTENH